MQSTASTSFMPRVHAGGAGAFAAVGAWPSAGGVGYRVWAPDRSRVRALIELPKGTRAVALAKEPDGCFAGFDPEGRAGDLYRFESEREIMPDPASRFQPRGVTGPSQVVDPSAFSWRETSWRRPALHGRVIYELHVGAFTPDGTFRAAIDKLGALAELGVNTLELMPVADFAGARNWGYDGVMPFAPARCYGTPDELRMLVDAAHARGLAVMLDVVYNHLGPVGNVLPFFSERYFHADRENLWGKALNFEAAPVRRFFLQNACMWLDEYRFDGLRLDAIHAIEDESPRHIVADLASAAHARGAFVVAEDERNEVEVITPCDKGGWGVDGVWADDFHHTARVALTGQRESHFGSFDGTPGEWARTLRDGWLYQGRHCPHLDAPRGTPAGHRPPGQFVLCISNHDQVGNRPLGDRLHDAVLPEAYRALSMLLCLAPGTPMLFMGQEWAAASPFVYFTDLPGEVGENMAENRRREFARYGAHYAGETLANMPDPQSDAAFASSKLAWEERERKPHRGVLALYRACLGLRAREEIFQSPERVRWDVARIGEHLLALRWRGTDGDWLLLIGTAAGEGATGESSFLHNTADRRWQLALASNDVAFGGAAAPVRGEREGFVLSTPGAVLFHEVAG